MTIPNNQCPFNECDGSGRVWWIDWSLRFERHQKHEWMEECDCFRQRQLQAKIQLSHVPENFREAKINNFDLTVYKKQDSHEVAALAKEAAKNFVWYYPELKKKGKGLYFYSRTKGSGKTRLISSISNAVSSQYRDEEVIYIQADALLKEIKRTFDDPKLSSYDVEKKFMLADLLIIDDFGVEKLADDRNGWIERTITSIVNSRLESKKITIFSSNFKISELNTVYQQGRVQSRVEEMALEIQMPEEDIRTSEAHKANEEIEYLLFQGKEA